MLRRAGGLVVAIVLASVAFGMPSAVAKKAPVSLSGRVNNHGTKDVSQAKSAKLDVELDNFYISPTFVKVQPGEKLTIKLENEGNVPHTFTSDGLAVDKQLSAGKSGTVKVTVPTSGKVFEFYCQFHKSSGMQGALFTTAGTSGATDSSSSSASGLGY